MGCFSFLCKICGKGILSNSSRGEKVKLYLLRDGKIIEQMEGEYDSYGRVFTDDFKDSIQWEMDWADICKLNFHGDANEGIAAIHSRCDPGVVPVTKSPQDPHQGWGETDIVHRNKKYRFR